MMNISKSSRILELYKMLQMGQVVNKQEMAVIYKVSDRSIQRDLDTIRNFFSDQCVKKGVIQEVEYDKKLNGYHLITEDVEYLTEGELLAICKILIESRAFSKEKLKSLLDKILKRCMTIKDCKKIVDYIANELFAYMDPKHASADTERLWEIAEAIQHKQIIEITYAGLNQTEAKLHRIMPVGILFSEYYFYIMGIINDSEKRKHFHLKDDQSPTIYRIDRIKSINILKETFKIAYRNKFKEGEYKNRTQYMFGGKTQCIRFRYFGASIEAVLDRLPTATVIKEKGSRHVIEAEVFGTGILMWLLSQGRKVEVLSPPQLRTAWEEEAKAIVATAMKGAS